MNWMGRTALELIGQAGLGYSFDSLTEESVDTYGGALKMFMCVPHSTNRALKLNRRHLPNSIHAFADSTVLAHRYTVLRCTFSSGRTLKQRFPFP